MNDDIKKAGYAAIDAKLLAIEKRSLVEDAQLAERAFKEQARIAEDIFQEMYKEAMI